MFNPPNIQELKKKHKLSINSIEHIVNRKIYGKFAIKAMESGYLHSKQIEAARRAIIKTIKKLGRVHIRLFPFLPVTNKPAETRMGKGKGNIAYWVAPVKAGRILFELYGINLSRDKAVEAFKFASAKLPIKVKFL